jgi:uncharacterized protein (DUF433 family)
MARLTALPRRPIFVAMASLIHPRVSVDPAVCGGRPVIAGTRVRVSDVLDMLAGGASVGEIVDDFPYVSAEDVAAALAFAARDRDHPVVTASG